MSPPFSPGTHPMRVGVPAFSVLPLLPWRCVSRCPCVPISQLDACMGHQEGQQKNRGGAHPEGFCPTFLSQLPLSSPAIFLTRGGLKSQREMGTEGLVSNLWQQGHHVQDWSASLHLWGLEMVRYPREREVFPLRGTGTLLTPTCPRT